MTNRQRIELRLSKVRTRLNEIAGLEGDDFTDEVQAEADELETEFGDLERTHRAAFIAEADEEEAANRPVPRRDHRLERDRSRAASRTGSPSATPWDLPRPGPASAMQPRNWPMLSVFRPPGSPAG